MLVLLHMPEDRNGKDVRSEGQTRMELAWYMPELDETMLAVPVKCLKFIICMDQ